MWLIERCKLEWQNNHEISYNDIVSMAEEATPFKCFINPDADCFANPKSMIEAIEEYCKKTDQPQPTTIGETARCIYESLAYRYKQVLQNLQKLANFPIKTLHIIGGGSKNNMLNQFTANAIGIQVIGGPYEATAIGNILMQAKADGIVKDAKHIRHIVRNSVNLEVFSPTDTKIWEDQYARYLSVYKENIDDIVYFRFNKQTAASLE